MGIRETINENKNLSLGIAAGVLLLALILIIVQLFGGGGSTPTAAFYSTEDGKEIIEDRRDKVFPFEKNGKTYFAANVYKCGGERWVNHIERITDEGKRQLEQMATANPEEPVTVALLGPEHLEVKRPGESAWVRLQDMANSGAVHGPALSAQRFITRA